MFARIFTELAQPGPEGDTIMIDSTHLKAHRTAASLSKGGLASPPSGATCGGLNSKLHMVCDGRGRPLMFFLSAGQMSDAGGALALLDDLPAARVVLLANKGYEADWFRGALRGKGIASCIPARRGRRNSASHDRALYRQRHRILFARIKDWRRMATRYDSCGELSLSAICIAATLMFWFVRCRNGARAEHCPSALA